MNTANRLSFVLQFVIHEILESILRPLWLSDVSAFQAKLDATDCYPFRVCYDLGECKQLWMQSPGTEDCYREDFSNE